MDLKDCIFTQIFGMKEYSQQKEKQHLEGKQGKVHARVSIDLLKEFKSYIYFKTTIQI